MVCISVCKAGGGGKKNRYKRDSKHECTNYRGISLLDVMSKLYEKVLDHRMQALQAVVAPGKGVCSRSSWGSARITEWKMQCMGSSKE
jgi:hypothetical protein